MDTETAVVATEQRIFTSSELLARTNNIGLDILTLAQDLVRSIDATPGLMAQMISEGGNRYTLQNLERYGRGQIDVRLVLDSSPIAARLARLPLSEQRQVLDTGVAVLDDNQDHRIIQYSEMTPEQQRQTIASDHLRPLSEQRSWRDQRREVGNLAVLEPEVTPWKKVGHKIEIPRGELPPLVLEVRDIRSMLQLLTR